MLREINHTSHVERSALSIFPYNTRRHGLEGGLLGTSGEKLWFILYFDVDTDKHTHTHACHPSNLREFKLAEDALSRQEAQYCTSGAISTLRTKRIIERNKESLHPATPHWRHW